MEQRGSGCFEVIHYASDDFSMTAFELEQDNVLIEGKGLCFHKGKWRFKSLVA
jgi:hypothetical protein